MFNPSYSFEFFPPKTEEGFANLNAACTALQVYKPEFFSVTFGAGGSTQAGSLRAIKEVIAQGAAVTPHLSCIGASRASIAELLETYKSLGIRRIIALRGDLPSGYGMGGEFRYAADLVSFIRETTGDAFELIVASYPEYHPQAKNAKSDLDAFAAKVKAGANRAITQYFFNTDAYFHFLDEVEKRGINTAQTPIIPGIMPITNFSQLARFSDACGAEIPRWMRLKFESFGDDAASIKAFGHDAIADLCTQLLAGGAPSLHFYTMNRAEPSAALIQALQD